MTTAQLVPHGRRTLAALGTALSLIAAAPAACLAAEYSATPATLKSVFANASGGDTIMLSAGDYGLFRGAEKDGMVTLSARPGEAVRMDFDFNPASNITLDGVIIREGGLASERTKNIVVRNSDIPGQIVFRTAELANANILFDNNVHRDWSQCDVGCSGGRMSFLGRRSEPVGITISDSEFRGGRSDGIASGANGLRIIGNVFHDIIRDDDLHVDALQLIDSSNTLIRGNHFYNVPTVIMAPDGTDHEVIEDNVVAVNPDGEGYPYAISMGSDDGSVIRHNTFADGPCSFNARCGVIRVGAKPNDDRGRGTIIKDNVIGSILIDDDGTTVGEVSGNLIANRSLRDNLRGVPTFVGGARPGSFEGFALTPGSLGKGGASDGLDIGVRFGTLHPPAGTAPTPSSRPRIGVLSNLRSIRQSGRLRLRVRMVAPGTVVLAGRVRAGASGKWHKMPIATVRFTAAGSRSVSLRLSRSSRRALARARSGRLSLLSYADRGRKRRTGTFGLPIRR